MAQIRANESKDQVSVHFPSRYLIAALQSPQTAALLSNFPALSYNPNFDSRFEGALQSHVGHDLRFWFYLTGSAMQMLP